MNITLIANRLLEKHGTHRKVAQLLLINEKSYNAIRAGRAKPSKRLVRMMELLLKDK